MFDLDFLNKELREAEFVSALGGWVAHLMKTVIGGVETELIALRIEQGKGLHPHVHEHGGEIGLPLTRGFVRFGMPEKDEKGKYIFENDKVKVAWEEAIELVPGKSIEVPEGKAHMFYASDTQDFTICFFLPSSHLSTDRKFVTTPEK